MQFRARTKLVFRRHRDSQVGGSRPRRWRGARGMSFPSPLPPAPATIYFRDDSSHLHVYSGCLDTYHFRASTKSVSRRLRDSQVGELETTATGRVGGESPCSSHDFPRPLLFNIGHPPQTYACVRGRCAYIQLSGRREISLSPTSRLATGKGREHGATRGARRISLLPPRIPAPATICRVAAPKTPHRQNLPTKKPRQRPPAPLRGFWRGRRIETNSRKTQRPRRRVFGAAVSRVCVGR